MPLPASVIGSGRDCGLLEGCWANTVAGVIGAIESEDPRCIGRFSVYGDSFRHPGPRDTAHTTHRALPVAVLVACLLLTLRIVHRRPRLPAHAAIPRNRRATAPAVCGRGAAFAQRSGNRAGCRCRGSASGGAALGTAGGVTTHVPRAAACPALSRQAIERGLRKTGTAALRGRPRPGGGGLFEHRGNLSLAPATATRRRKRVTCDAVMVNAMVISFTLSLKSRVCTDSIHPGRL